jgi:hypothetical protein
LSAYDFQELEFYLNAAPFFDREMTWPSVILGEMLAQGEAPQDIQSIPLSRAAASFSYCQARATIVYGMNRRISVECASRLEKLESESSFTRRPITVRELRRAWSFVDDYFEGTNFQREWVRQIIEIIEKDSRPQVFSSAFKKLDISLSRLAGGIEDRVLEFERAIENLLKCASSDAEMVAEIPLIIAGLCFLVGRGTSHINLLDEYAADFPAVYIWFGVLAGLAGPTAWDSHWSRVITAIERQLRAGFRLIDPPTTDLCWIEYEWIASQRVPLPWLQELTKLYPRLVSVEVFPGATCQFRLTGTEDLSRKDPPARREPVVSNGRTELQSHSIDTALVEKIAQRMAEALADVRSLLPSEVHFSQKGLFEHSSSQEVKKTSRKRSPKKQP